jgi:oxygen-independent coproporphyrinogen-3 oxidase
MNSKASAEVSRETIDAASEFVFLGLRLTSGVDPNEFRERFGADLGSRWGIEMDRAIDDGLLEFVDGRLRLTRRGMLFSNDVFSIFV